MSRRAAGALALVALALLGLPPAARAREKRLVISLGGGAALGTLGWSRSATWPVHQEMAQLIADQEAGTGPAFEGSVSYRFSRRVGVRAAYGWSRRELRAALRAEIPHPFLFEAPRSLQAGVSGLEYRERAAHLDLELWPVAGRFEVGVFGGVALLGVEADFVEQVEYDAEYPHDEISFRSATTRRSSSDGAVGWSAGAVLAHALGGRFGVAVRARYTKARAGLTAPGGETTEFDAGGWRAAALLRFGF